MQNQKLENLLNLSLSATEEERQRSLNLGVGYTEAADTWEVIIRYVGSLERVRELSISVTELLGGFAVLTLEEAAIDRLSELPEVSFVEKPKSFYFSIQGAKSASCIQPVQRAPFGLSGQGVLLACVDSGVDIRHPDFQNADGTTRILYLWDQTIPGDPPKGFVRGSEYTADQLNAILKEAGSPMRIPGADITGHGTEVLGIAAGNGRGSGGQYSGVATEADLVVVKLGVSVRNGFPRTTEIMEGVDYCVRKAVELQRPMAINLSFGNNYGPHNGRSLLEIYLNTVSGIGKNLICVGMGNEGFASGHTSLTFTTGQESIVEFSVGEYESELNIQIWKSYADQVEISVEGPSGTIAGPLRGSLGPQRLRVDGTNLLIYYGEPAPYGTAQEIYLDFIPTGNYLASGVWRIRFFPVSAEWRFADLWLPSADAIGAATKFLTPVAANTLTIPSTAFDVLSVGAYDSDTNGFADFSGRGALIVPWGGKPDIAAPGVDIRTTAAGGGYTVVSGTSFATPFASGSAALLMEWGIVRGNDPFLYGDKIRAYFRKGARTLPGFNSFPNNWVGYGALCLRDSLPI